MIRHQILLSSSYSEGTRICLDFTDSDYHVVKDAIDRVSKAYDGKRVSFSVHTIHTDSADWSSVVKKDPYFDDVHLVETVEEFVEKIQKDRYLDGVDVAKYILSTQDCTHTRIQKLAYMCYADYLCKTKEQLFKDKIYAFEYGPVVGSIYQTLRGYSKEHPTKYIDDTKTFRRADISAQIKSRILFAEDGDEKLKSMEETLKKFDSVSTEDLIKLTHMEKTPWSVATERRRSQDDDSYYTPIKDEDILEYHSNEEVSIQPQ